MLHGILASCPLHHQTGGYDPCKNRIESDQDPSSVPTRIRPPKTLTNSTLAMLQRLIHLRSAIGSFFSHLDTPEGTTEFPDVKLKRPNA